MYRLIGPMGFLIGFGGNFERVYCYIYIIGYIWLITSSANPASLTRNIYTAIRSDPFCLQVLNLP